MYNKYRRPIAALSVFGVSYIKNQNPYIVAWWAAAYPGFGHYLLNQYARGTILTLFEVVINTMAHINDAIVYSLCGKLDMAVSVLEMEWTYIYVIIYFFSIWDSYRSTLVQNRMYYLAEQENRPITPVTIHSFEIQYLERRNPYLASFYSLLFPGLGQFYGHRIWLGIYAMFWWAVYSMMSHSYLAAYHYLTGNVQQAVSVLNMHWLMFMPSVMGGSVYHAFRCSLDHSRLFCIEQRQFLAERYGKPETTIFP